MGNVIDLEERGPGRVRTPARRPGARRKIKVAAYNVALRQFTEVDSVVRAALGGTIEVLYATRDAVAQEAASLLFEREQAVPGSREAARTSSRRIAALAEVGRLTVLIARAAPGEPSPERLRRVLGQLRTDVEEAVDELFDEPVAAALRAALAASLPEDPVAWGQGRTPGR